MSSKAKSAAREGRIKLHIFEPSGRRVWTVVGKSGEHWVDDGFCSCQAYYFAMLKGAPGCYHAESIRASSSAAQILRFQDSQYGQFLAEIASRLAL